MKGTQVHHFKILEKIGEGGMGEVYEALDTRLERKVALKFLPPAYSKDPEFKGRFEHEARAAAALNHPNIITVHDLGEFEGRTYIAMELISGQTLEERIRRGDLALPEALKVAAQVCEGLAAAHEAGIVHRDIKPANIFLTKDGRAKILDFGLAKSRRTSTDTKPGTTVGTIQYESPEQSRGSGVDARSDLFSLGVVLYEMVTAQRPFKGEFEDAVRYAIAHEQPEPMARYKSDVPDDLQRIVSKLLEKDPDLRYQTATGVLSDLKLLQRSSGPSAVHAAYSSASRPATGTAPRRLWRYVFPAFGLMMAAALLLFKPWKLEIQPTQVAEASAERLAVMYFDNLTDPDDTQRQGEVISSLIISDLSESQRLQVVSSQRLYDLLKNLGREGTRKITPDVATEVARKADARWMLTGRILSGEPNWVVSAELSDVATGDLLASPSITGKEGERIFDVVDRLTSEIKRQLSLPSGGLADIDKPVIELTTESSDAYRLYVEGRELVYKFLMADAEEKFRQALAIDSTFAMAYYYIGFGRLSYFSDYPGAREMFAAAVRHVDHTSERDGNVLRGTHANIEGRAEEAIGYFQKVIDQYPDDKEAVMLLAQVYNYSPTVRDMHKAIELYSKVIEMDPQFKMAYNALAYGYDAVGDIEHSLVAINKYAALAPDEPNPWDSKAELLANNGRLEEALQSYLKAIEVQPDFLYSLRGAIGLYRLKGDYAGADRLIDALLSQERPENQSNGRWERARNLIHQGRFNAAVEQLSECYRFDRAHKELHAQAGWAFAERAYLKGLLRDEPGSRKELDRAQSSLEEHFSREETRQLMFVPRCAQAAWFGREREADSLLAEMHTVLGKPLAPDTSAYFTTMGLSRFFREAYDSAAVYLDRAKLPRPEFSQLYWLGRAYIGKRQVRDALGYLERAEAMCDQDRAGDPALSVLIHFYLAEAYEKSGRTPDAVKEYQAFLEIWKDADAGIQEVTDAKLRLAALQT